MLILNYTPELTGSFWLTYKVEFRGNNNRAQIKEDSHS